MEPIGCFLNRHAGEPAWIFGKGPSLDLFPMDQAGPLRLCINESALVVPEPTYFFAHDEGPIQRVAAKWPQGCIAVLEPARALYAAWRKIPDDSIFTYGKRQDDSRVLAMTAEQIADHAVLYGRLGTVHSALHFCRLVGVSSVTLVGFDGSEGYAKKLGVPDGGWNHDKIRRYCVEMLEAMGMEHEFWAPPEEAEPPAPQGSSTPRP